MPRRRRFPSHNELFGCVSAALYLMGHVNFFHLRYI